MLDFRQWAFWCDFWLWGSKILQKSKSAPPKKPTPRSWASFFRSHGLAHCRVGIPSPSAHVAQVCMFTYGTASIRKLAKIVYRLICWKFYLKTCGFFRHSISRMHLLLKNSTEVQLALVIIYLHASILQTDHSFHFCKLLCLFSLPLHEAKAINLPHFKNVSTLGVTPYTVQSTFNLSILNMHTKVEAK